MEFHIHLSDKWSRFNNNVFLYSNWSESYLPQRSELFREKLIDSLADTPCILHDNNKLLIQSDRYNTAPIYFVRINNEIIVSDSLKYLLGTSKFSFSTEQAWEHLLFDFSFTPFKTLINNVCKIPAGTTIELSCNGEYKVIKQLDNAVPKTASSMTETQFLTEVTQLKEEILRRTTPHDSFYIPLSGGLDSRLLLGILAKYTSAEIYSRTYGDIRSLDVKNGTRVAQKLNIRHEIISKTDEEALSEFEQTVLESAGELNGVHGHDLAGREMFENGPWRARISGFIGDLLARGANLEDSIESKDEALANYLGTKTNFFKYDYNKLIHSRNQNSTELIKGTISTHLSEIFETYGDYKSLTWDYYITKRVGCMTSLLEYFTHVSKPNYKPLLIPEVRQFISENAGNDKWPGMGYVQLAKALFPELLDIPLSSNSVFVSRYSMFRFKLRRRSNLFLNRILSKGSKGYIFPLPFNATLNWGAILRRNPVWVKKNIISAAETFELNKNYIDALYIDHCEGKRTHEEILLRIISLGVIANTL